MVDTNVLVGAGLKQFSWPAWVLRWIERNGGLLKTLATELELMSVLARPRPAKLIRASFAENPCRILAVAEPVAIRETVAGCRDRKDDKVLELAVNGLADMIVSGDADLLVLDLFRGIPIIDPAMF